MARTVDLHGLRIRSDVPLEGPAAGGDGTDLVVRLRDPAPVGGHDLAGTVLAEHRLPAGGGYALVADWDAVRLVVPRVCSLALGEGRIDVRADPSAPVDLVGLLVGGAGLAAWLTLSGAPVLHAAAVSVDGTALVVAGPSGAGKSTIAARMCADGAALVTDDLLRLDLGEGVWCHRGTRAVRLRRRAFALADGLDGAQRRPTVDHRLAASFPHHPAPQLPVGAVIVPRLAGEDRLVIRRLGGSDAVVALASATRIQGWRDPQVLRRSLHQWRTVAARVPVLELSAPWRRLAEPGLLETLASAVRSGAAP